MSLHASYTVPFPFATEVSNDKALKLDGLLSWLSIVAFIACQSSIKLNISLSNIEVLKVQSMREKTYEDLSYVIPSEFIDRNFHQQQYLHKRKDIHLRSMEICLRLERQIYKNQVLHLTYT